MSTYSQLKKIIPSDQALANKAVEASLQQVKNIFDAALPILSLAVYNLESNKGLPLINALTVPLPADVTAFYTAYATGTGTDGTLLLADVIGTAAGWVHNTELPIATSVISTLTSAGALTSLTNSTTGVFTIMQNTNAGLYTTVVSVGPPEVISIDIPFGLPGAGTYSSYNDAYNQGLIPAAYGLIASIVAAHPTVVAQSTVAFSTMAAQLVRENTNLAQVPIVFSQVTPGIPPSTLVDNLKSYGRDIVEGGAAYILEALATMATRGGQAVVSTMREGRNLARLSAAGISTDILVSDVGIEPPAPLSSGNYTVDQAIAQVII